MSSIPSEATQNRYRICIGKSKSTSISHNLFMAASLPYPAIPYLNLSELVMTLMLASLLSWTADSNISNCCFLSTRNYSIRDMRLGLDSTLLPFYAVNSATSHFNNFRTFYSRLSIYAFLL
jgi:hypothetical protein